ncbi:exopolyphosphatase [Mucilaginibacter sp. X4EP1]|uniref:Ppx/GppA phosphatase family protein n=1 Tax=Mucilaginibacter sp. X4EP1 TaxID=2723092 RepID=UPI002169C6B6|nr:exopolyphosphatase [Mucilaginibacter sp. X4EP1]MCS3812588.1 exopolyphosphatase/guanosine-5'-triphosphate,3'-diphosphate pyrophosphatase [Mucilaginibacter sp. X4EP1]
MNNKKTPPLGGWGVMDLGTNTFHLLIVEADQSGIKEIVHQQQAVKIGEGGINKGFIQPAAFERGIKAMQHFGELIAANNVHQVRAIATSALRSAANGQAFIDEVKTQTGIAIEIIDGDAEATFIYKGVKADGCLSEQNSLIVDIGGGSVEFIICNKDEMLWKQSFEIGAARLMDKFHRTDPIPPDSINALNLYLEDCLKDLFIAAAKYPIENMIGSSGVFESYAEITELDKDKPFDIKQTKHYSFEPDKLLTLIERIVLSTHQQRLEAKGIIPVRIDMIVVASLLTRFVIEKLEINKVIMSTSSLKEGVLAEMMG